MIFGFSRKSKHLMCLNQGKIIIFQVHTRFTKASWPELKKVYDHCKIYFITSHLYYLHYKNILINCMCSQKKKTYFFFLIFLLFESYYLSTFGSTICSLWCIEWEVSVVCMKAHWQHVLWPWLINTSSRWALQ